MADEEEAPVATEEEAPVEEAPQEVPAATEDGEVKADEPPAEDPTASAEDPTASEENADAPAEDAEPEEPAEVFEQPIDEVATDPWIEIDDEEDQVLFTHVYEIGKVLGGNEFGETCKGYKKDDRTEVAVRIISKMKLEQYNKDKKEYDEAKVALAEQITILKNVRDHPNVVKLVGVFESKTSIYLCLEKCAGGDLAAHLDNQDGHRYDEEFVRDIIKQAARGIRYLHASKIAHCDIRPRKLLYAGDPLECEVKVCDFGIAPFAKGRRSQLVKAAHYMAPEIINGTFGMCCDCWSLGCLTFFLLYGFHAFAGTTIEKIRKKILKKKYFKNASKMYFTSHSPGSSQARDFISKLIEPDVNKRMTIKEAMKHPWLKKGTDLKDAPKLSGVMQSMKKLSSNAKFKQEVLTMMTGTHMSNDEIDDLKMAFEAADKDGGGTLSIEELSEVMKTQGSFSEDDIKVVIKNADVDGDGLISYEELLAMVVQQKLAGDESRVAEAFAKFDTDGNGLISLDEMVSVLGKPRDEVEKMMNEVDKSGDCQLDFKEFMGMWAKENGAYLWDEDEDDIEADRKAHEQEMLSRRGLKETTTTVTSETAEVDPNAPKKQTADEMMAELEAENAAAAAASGGNAWGSVLNLDDGGGGGDDDDGGADDDGGDDDAPAEPKSKKKGKDKKSGKKGKDKKSGKKGKDKKSGKKGKDKKSGKKGKDKKSGKKGKKGGKKGKKEKSPPPPAAAPKEDSSSDFLSSLLS